MRLPLTLLIIALFTSPGFAQRIPAGTTVLSGADIERRGYSTLADAARWSPGLAVIDLGPRGGVFAGSAPRSVRGLYAGVPAYLGDIPIAFDPWLHDMERVEVRLGPRGVLYGPGAMAGVVRYTPRKPDARRRTFEARGGGFTRAHGGKPGGDVGLTANLPLAEDRLALRASLGMHRDAGFIDYGHVLREPGTSHPEPAPGTAAAHLRREPDRDAGRTLSTRMSLLWNATEDIEVVLAHQGQTLKAEGYRANHARAFGTGRYESAQRYTEPVDRRDQVWSLNAHWDMGPAKLSSTMGYTRWSGAGQRDQTDLLLRNFAIGGLLPPDATLPDFAAQPCDSANPSPFCAFSAFTRDESEVKALHWTARLTSTGHGPWGWSVGAAYRDQEAEFSSWEFAPGLSRFADISPRVPMDVEYFSDGWDSETRRSLFGGVSRRLGGRMRVYAGARWFDIEEAQGSATELPFTPEYDSPYTETRGSHDGLLFSLGAAYRLGENRFVYAARTQGRGNRAGSSNPFRVCTREDIEEGEGGGQPSCIHERQKQVRPDSMTHYEIGLRGSWLGGRVAVTGALFHTEWADARMPGRTPYSKQSIIQNTDARTRGIDFVLALRPTEALALRGFWSYARAELTEDAPGLLPDGEDAFKGDRLDGAPEHRGGVIVSHRMRPLDGLHLELSYDYSHVGGILTRIGGRGGGERRPGYGVHGLSASLWRDSSSWTITLYAENLLDKYAVVSSRGVPTDIRVVDGFALRTYWSYVLPPRRVGLRFRYAF